MERLQRIFSGVGGGAAGPHPDSPLMDSSEQVYISSLALLKMLKHGKQINIPSSFLLRPPFFLHILLSQSSAFLFSSLSVFFHYLHCFSVPFLSLLLILPCFPFSRSFKSSQILFKVIDSVLEHACFHSHLILTSILFSVFQLLFTSFVAPWTRSIHSSFSHSDKFHFQVFFMLVNLLTGFGSWSFRI